MRKGILLGAMAAILVTLFMWFIGPASYSMDVAPNFVGNASTDSVYIVIATVDTSYHQEVDDLDSLIVIRYRQDGGQTDSLGEDAATVKNFTKGFYRIAFRGSDASGTLGIYTVVVKGWYGGILGGIAACTYTVIEDNVGTYLAYLDANVSGASTFDPDTDPVMVDEIKQNTLGDTTLQDNATEYGGGDAVWTAAEKDSVVKLVTILRDSLATACQVFDHTLNKVTLVDTSAGSIHTIELEVVNVDGWNPATTGVLLQNGAISSPTFTLNAITEGVLALNCITASEIGPGCLTSAAFASNALTSTAVTENFFDECWSNPYMTLTALQRDSLMVFTQGAALHFGSLDGYRTIYFPGNADAVDSIWIVDSGATPDSIMARIIMEYNGQYPAGERFFK